MLEPCRSPDQYLATPWPIAQLAALVPPHTEALPGPTFTVHPLEGEWVAIAEPTHVAHFGTQLLEGGGRVHVGDEQDPVGDEGQGKLTQQEGGHGMGL